LSNKYGDIMDKVEVTDEMRTRIISNIGSYDFQKVEVLHSIARKRRYIALAACLVLVLFAAVAIPKFMAQNQDVTDTGGSGIVECSSISELSQSVGFTVKEVNYVTFKVSKTTYTDNDGMAEITYKGTGKESVVYRMSKGDEDNSGDYSEYKSTVKADIAGSKVTLKGNDGAYVLAIWSDGTYSYSIALTSGANKAEWHKIIESIQ